MQLIGLDDNISKFGGGGRYIGGHGGFLQGLSEEAKDATECENIVKGGPCFAMSADYQSYDISICKHPLFWSLMGGYLYDEKQIGQTFDGRRDFWEQIMNLILSKFPPYLEETEGLKRKIYYAFEKDASGKQTTTPITDKNRLAKLHNNNGKLDLSNINPEIIAIAMGGAFRDQAGNTYFAASWGHGNGDTIPRGLLKDGYFGHYEAESDWSNKGHKNRIACLRNSKTLDVGSPYLNGE